MAQPTGTTTPTMPRGETRLLPPSPPGRGGGGGGWEGRRASPPLISGGPERSEGKARSELKAAAGSFGPRSLRSGSRAQLACRGGRGGWSELPPSAQLPGQGARGAPSASKSPGGRSEARPRRRPRRRGEKVVRPLAVEAGAGRRRWDKHLMLGNQEEPKGPRAGPISRRESAGREQQRRFSRSGPLETSRASTLLAFLEALETWLCSWAREAEWVKGPGCWDA
ncbi:uncharacterized protein LOC120313540 [Crotalus tigris]|uniref:uncharacterized protein LOC120313540 n=1 Tax=Crotalus tigris TaxID=88082 RepID=UPI00192F6E9B|nr:uncharacterized protein LOC120313540 [Crotalus tigris]